MAINLVACQSGDNRDIRIYYDLQSTLEHQMVRLNEHKPSVQKRVELDGKVEESILTLDSAGWLREFEIFLENRINKPSFVGAFEEQHGQNRLVYSRKDPDADGVKQFEVTYWKDSIPKEISITSISGNFLYTSHRELKLNFELIDNNLSLHEYSVKGTQTILNQSPTEYSMLSKIIY